MKTKYIYRGVVVEHAEEAQTLKQQMNRPDLIYRGVHHDGERTVEPKADKKDLFYRGAHYA